MKGSIFMLCNWNKLFFSTKKKKKRKEKKRKEEIKMRI
jgi:hypothetical protein